MEIILIALAVLFVLVVIGGVVQLFFKGLYLLLPKPVQVWISKIGSIIETVFQWTLFAWCIVIGGWLGISWSYVGMLGGSLIGFVVGYGIFRTIGDRRKLQQNAQTSNAGEA